MISYKERLNHITTFMFDVDGVLTDGSILLINNDVIRSMDAKDGYALQYASKMGYKIFIVTGGKSHDVKDRLEGLGVTEVHLSSHTKLAVYNDIKERHQLIDKEIAYMGDDIPDYPVMKTVGLAACPQDAVPEIKAIAHYQSPKNGGENCVRDIIEQTLRVQGKWFTEKAFKW
jgi:3-deoxy-D-manno-octulosonate 8-phosphate phosphatase (KDO 8-P phosphatase)